MVSRTVASRFWSPSTISKKTASPPCTSDAGSKGAGTLGSIGWPFASTGGGNTVRPAGPRQAVGPLVVVTPPPCGSARRIRTAARVAAGSTVTETSLESTVSMLPGDSAYSTDATFRTIDPGGVGETACAPATRTPPRSRKTTISRTKAGRRKTGRAGRTTFAPPCSATGPYRDARWTAGPPAAGPSAVALASIPSLDQLMVTRKRTVTALPAPATMSPSAGAPTTSWPPFTTQPSALESAPPASARQ